MNLRSIDPDALLLLQRESLSDLPGDLDASDGMLLDQAFAYPLNQAVMQHADVADLAAAYAVGILKYRPFVVGNEHAAFLAMGLFLYLNNWQLNASSEEAARVIWQASAADLGEDELANWVRSKL
ncbi:MAG TPA: Fic family protein [Noviherbaspirillum sp.]|nr:Fic family protein [Noviherbaspirillum sp.]